MRYTSIFIIIVLLGLACSSAEKEEVKSKPTTTAVKVKTTQLQEDPGGSAIHALGIVMSSNEAKPAFKTGGIINRTFVKEGETVKKGQLLATLIMTEINAQVQQAEEAYIKSERDFNRVKNLHKDSVATLEQLQNATTALEVMKRNVDIAKFNKQYSEVRSPIAGKVVKQLLHSGEIAGPGYPVYAIIGTEKTDWKVNAGLVDRDWARVKKGDRCDIVFDAYPDQTFKAVVKDKSAVGGNANGNIDIELKLLEQPASLAAGMTAKVTITTEKKSANKVIPIESLENSNGKTARVYVVEGKTAKAKNIVIGQIQGSFVEVVSGLSPNDKIVTTGTKFLEDGDAIEEEGK